MTEKGPAHMITFFVILFCVKHYGPFTSAQCICIGIFQQVLLLKLTISVFLFVSVQLLFSKHNFMCKAYFCHSSQFKF